MENLLLSSSFVTLQFVRSVVVGEFQQLPIINHARVNSYRVHNNIMSSMFYCFCRTVDHEVYANNMTSSFDEIKNLYQNLKTEWNKRKPDFKQCNSILLQIKVRKITLKTEIYWKSMIGFIVTYRTFPMVSSLLYTCCRCSFTYH